MSTTVLLVLLGVFGLAVGSFLNVVIVRIPSHESLLRPPSKCPQCEQPIRPGDNIPVVSWVLLKGRCRNCGEPIPAGYPLVEITNSVLWVIAGAWATWSLELSSEATVAVSLAFAVLFSVLLALSVIDLELYILPNKITYPSVLASLIILPLLSWVVGEDVVWGLGRAVVGGLGYAGFLAIVLIAWDLIMRRPGMGVGDVKLAALLGLWVGWVSPYLVLYALIAASLIGLVAGGVAFAIRKENREYPYGPWMALGALVVLLAQEPILDFMLGTT